MTRFDDLDRGLAAFFDGEALAPAPTGLLDRVVEATAMRRSRPRWSAVTRQTQVHVGWRSIQWDGPVLRLVAVLLLLLALLGIGVTIGARWWELRPVLGGFERPIQLATSPSTRVVQLANGRTLVFGLVDPFASATAVGVVDPTTRRIHPAGRTHNTPDWVVPEADGTVVVFGSTVVEGQPRVTAERYDPTTGISTDIAGHALDPADPGAVHGPYPAPASMIEPFTTPDGRMVMINWDGVHLYDSRDGSELRMDPPFGAGTGVERAARLADGRVLIVEDFGDGMLTPNLPVRQRVAIFDPDEFTFNDLPPLPEARIGYTVTALPDGTALIAGGANAGADGTDATPMSTIWILDPGTGEYRVGGPLAVPRWFHSATLLADGHVLIAGGSLETIAGRMDDAWPLTPDATTELYDPTLGRSTPGPVMGAARVDPETAAFADGGVLVVGGSGDGPDLGATVGSAEFAR